MNDFSDTFISDNKLIFKKYKPIKKIGSGSFSNIYSVFNLNDKKYYALKSEKINSDKKLLEAEAYFLFTLQGFGIPKFISFGHTKKYNILIEELLDKSLNTIFIENNKKCNLIDICLIGIQLIDRLEWIHSKHIVYRDIKPENFLIGKNDPNVIYIVDFGFCKKYRSSKTGKHILPKLTGLFSGTLKYASPHTVRGKVSSRRDDLISLGYMLIYLYKKSLPWDFYMPQFDTEQYLKIMHLKENNGAGSLFNNLPIEIVNYIKYTRNLKFEEKPNYSYLRSLFEKILFNNNFDYRFLTFSWIHPENKIFFGIPLNSSLRKNNSQSKLLEKMIIKNVEKNRNISHSNFERFTEGFSIPSVVPPKSVNVTVRNSDVISNEIKSFNLKENNLIKNNKIPLNIQPNNTNNLKIIKIGSIMNNKNTNFISNRRISPYLYKNINLNENNSFNIKTSPVTNKKNNIKNKKINIINFNKINISPKNFNYNTNKFLNNSGKFYNTTNNISTNNNKTLVNNINKIKIKSMQYIPLYQKINNRNNNYQDNAKLSRNINGLNKHNSELNNNINNYQNIEVNRNSDKIILINNKILNNRKKSPSPSKYLRQRKNIDNNMIYRYKMMMMNNNNKNIQRRHISPSPKPNYLNSKPNLNKYFITNNYGINFCHNYNNNKI